jgi:hypothetical protein
VNQMKQGTFDMVLSKEMKMAKVDRVITKSKALKEAMTPERAELEKALVQGTPITAALLNNALQSEDKTDTKSDEIDLTHSDGEKNAGDDTIEFVHSDGESDAKVKGTNIKEHAVLTVDMKKEAVAQAINSSSKRKQISPVKEEKDYSHIQTKPFRNVEDGFDPKHEPGEEMEL